MFENYMNTPIHLQTKEQAVNVANKISDACKQQTIKIEQFIKLRVKDKPKRMPEFIYKRILKKVLVMEYFK